MLTDAWYYFGYPGRAAPNPDTGLTLVTKTNPDGWQTPKDGWKTSTQWKIITDKARREAHIGFQYSKGKLDWLINFLFCLFPLPFLTRKVGNCRVHLGMAIKLASIALALRKAVFGYVASGYKIYLYGHSQGGGFAQVVLAYLSKENLRVEEVITWGALRVFSWFSNTDWLADKIKRREAEGDLVPHLPLVFLGYKSVGDRVKTGKNPWKWYSFFLPWTWYGCLYKAHTGYGESAEEGK